MLCGSRIIDTNVMSLGLPQKKSSLYRPFHAYRADSYCALRHSHRSFHHAVSFQSRLIVPNVPYCSYRALSFLKLFPPSILHNMVVFRHRSRCVSLQMATFCRASHVLPGWRWLSHFGLLNTQHIVWLNYRVSVFPSSELERRAIYSPTVEVKDPHFLV